jgi:hypothetical protein
MTKIPKLTVLPLLWFLAPSVYAATYTHAATIWFCPVAEQAHGNCISTREGGIVGFNELRIDCKVKKGSKNLLAQVTGSIYADNPDPFENNEPLNAYLYNTGSYCTINDGRFKNSMITVPGQSSGQNCATYVTPH